MRSSVAAAILILVLVSPMCLLAMPVQAHHVVGRPTAVLPYRQRDYDLHVPGPTGYVWPGAGILSLSTAPNVGSGAPSPITWSTGPDLPPGYQSPWSPCPPGAPTSWYQLAGNTYAPFGAILTSTDEHDNVGDLIFAINFTTTGFTAAPTEDYLYSSLIVYVPPEFNPPVDWEVADTSNIVTTITSERGAIYVWKADVKDPFGPGWWVIYINLFKYLYDRETERPAGRNPRGILFSKDNEYNEWYYVRVNAMRAPKIAGRYIFKIFLDDTFISKSTVNDDGTLRSFATDSTGSYPFTMPAENWPVVLVKGEVDPGIIEGTARYGAWNQALHNLPLQLPGRVRAVGIADDPYTGASTGRAVEARGYFNASAKGHYEVEGVAPGVYDVYASAAGYPEVKVASGVKVYPGNSIHLDFLLNPGPIITGVIYSKHSFGEVSWPSTRPVTVEIYDSNEWPAAKSGYDWGIEGLEFERGTGEVWTDQGYKVVDAHLKSFSPTNLTDSPYTSYVVGNVIYDPSGTGLLAPNRPKRVAFPWEHDTVGLPGVSWVGAPATTPCADPLGIFNGVGPAQFWWVDPAGTYTNDGGTNSFRFQFGIKSFYGAPIDFDGHVSQTMATWVNGLTAGTYYVRAWINGYVQTDVSGIYVDYPFTVAADEWAGDINTPMDLETSSWINKTVHFHDLPGTLDVQPIRGPDRGRYLIAEAYDADDVSVAMNFTWVPATRSSWNITLNGFGMIGPMPAYGSKAFDGYAPADMKFFLYRYRHIRDYGIMPGTYTIRVYMRGYVQQEFELATISLSSSPAHISNHMYRGAGINVTLYSVDWEHPRVDRVWTFDGSWIRVYVYNVETEASMGYVRYWDNSPGRWRCPKQLSGRLTVPYPDWESDWSKLKFNGSSKLELYGPDAEGWLDGTYWPWAKPPAVPDGQGKMGNQTGVWLEFGWGKNGFLTSPSQYRSDDLETEVALETGSYELRAYTFGYVQKKPITVYAQKGQQADTKINLVIGVNITANIKFKKEGIFTHLPYNSSVRIRVFDDNEALVATWHSSLYGGFYSGVIHDGSKAYGGYKAGPEGIGPDTGHPGTENRSWVRDSTTELQVLLAGNQAWVENDQYVVSPSDYKWSNYYGIDGYPNYQGNWRIEVDFVNLYQSDRSFPAPPGLLLGESYYLIKGVEGPYGGIWAYNHLGPWEQKMAITVPNAHLGAEVSTVFELDLRGLVSGQIAGFTWSDELRPTSWASIVASGAAGTFNAYSADGYYDMYLPAGSYEFTVYEWSPYNEGHNAKSTNLTVSTGQLVTGYSFYLERSNIPIPEFGAIIALVTALGASLYILRRTKGKG